MFTIKWSVALLPFLSVWFGGQQADLPQQKNYSNSSSVSSTSSVEIQTCKPYPECEIENSEVQGQ